MPTPQRTYDDWLWWEGAGAQSAAMKEFEALHSEGQGSLIEVMQRWLRGETTRRECEMIESDLWELKTRVGNNQYRILFCIRGRICYVLTAFRKDTQQTSERDKKRARKRRLTV